MVRVYVSNVGSTGESNLVANVYTSAIVYAMESHLGTTFTALDSPGYFDEENLSDLSELIADITGFNDLVKEFRQDLNELAKEMAELKLELINELRALEIEVLDDEIVNIGTETGSTLIKGIRCLWGLVLVMWQRIGKKSQEWQPKKYSKMDLPSCYFL